MTSALCKSLAMIVALFLCSKCNRTFMEWVLKIYSVEKSLVFVLVSSMSRFLVDDLYELGRCSLVPSFAVDLGRCE